MTFKTEKATAWVIGIAALVLLAWEVYVYGGPRTGDTISEVILTWAIHHPVVPFLAGVLSGHFFWYQVRPGVPDPETLAILDDLALATLVDRVAAEVEARKEARS